MRLEPYPAMNFIVAGATVLVMACIFRATTGLSLGRSLLAVLGTLFVAFAGYTALRVVA